MKIWKQYNKRTKGYEWRARFRFNKKTFRPVETTKEKLIDLIAEIRSQEKTERDNEKYNLGQDVVLYMPTLAVVFANALPKIAKDHQRTLADRVFKAFLALLPPEIKPVDLSQTHFQRYIDYRGGQLGKQTKQPVTRQTIYKELYAVKSALKKAKLYYDALEKWQVPQLPELPKGFKKSTKRERLISDRELAAIIDELMKPPAGKQTHAHHAHRVRLAHQIEFQFWSGLRRLEIVRLKFSQYDNERQALLNVKRWKTDSVTRFFPLGKRAVEIVEARRELQDDSEYIFTADGEPIPSDYRTLRKICKDLELDYGKFTDGGFIMHDLRHRFASDIIEHSDIRTAAELLGHSNLQQSLDYMHTNEKKLREAIVKRDKIDYDSELGNIFDEVRNGTIEKPEFNEKIKKLFNF